MSDATPRQPVFSQDRLPSGDHVDRRQFLGSTATVALGAALLGSVPGLAGEGDGNGLEVIDCHTHFYDPTRPQGVPWPGKNSPLYRTVLPSHLRAQTMPRPLTGTVIVEASPWVEDNQWLLDLAREDPFIVGIVGHLNPVDPEFATHVRRFAANPLFRGIRVSLQTLDQLLSDRRLESFRLLADHDLALDVNGGPQMPDAVAKLGGELPGLRIIVNHIANVRITSDAPAIAWKQAMASAASHKNVFCKVSALVEGAAREGQTAPSDVDFYRPYLDVVWQAFGEDRVIYGSNWPVSDRAADYATLQQIVLDYVTPLGTEATRQFFAKNAERAYKYVRRRPES